MWILDRLEYNKVWDGGLESDIMDGLRGSNILNEAFTLVNSL